MSQPDDPQRILLVRLSAIGDAILTMPVLSALRRRFPKAYIAWVTEPGPAKLIRGHQALDELIVVSKGWMKHPAEAWRLRQQLRAQRFDVALDPQGLTKSATIAWLSGARRRIGFPAPVGRELSLWLNNEFHTPEALHVVDRQLELLQGLGIHDPAAEFGMPRDEQAEDAIETLLRSLKIGSSIALINAGASWHSKVWPAERFGMVAKQLSIRHGIPSVVVWAGEQERGWAREIEQVAEGHAHLAPPTSLTELTALLRRADLYIGSDTGPMHMAAAVGTRCVAIFGPTRPEICGPYGVGHFPLQAYYQDGSCRERRKASNDAMRAISVEEVVAACDQALSHKPGQAA